MGFKELGKIVVGRTARNPIAWSFYEFCGRCSNVLGSFYGHARWTREVAERNERLRELGRELFPDLTVLAGPFVGMKYTSHQAFGSTLLPKLLGSYESELHGVLEEMLINNYASVVDIGCAEGYYAVGLGLRLPEAEVYAFDTAIEARQSCCALAKLNRLDNRVHIGGFCDATLLKSSRHPARDRRWQAESSQYHSQAGVRRDSRCKLNSNFATNDSRPVRENGTGTPNDVQTELPSL